MMASMLALAFAAQATDTTRSAREAFNACLRTYVNTSVEAHRSTADFQSAYAQQCAAQEAALREAIVRRETALRATRANADQSARDEIDEARNNFRERFEMAMQPQ